MYETILLTVESETLTKLTFRKKLLLRSINLFKNRFFNFLKHETFCSTIKWVFHLKASYNTFYFRSFDAVLKALHYPIKVIKAKVIRRPGSSLLGRRR